MPDEQVTALAQDIVDAIRQKVVPVEAKNVNSAFEREIVAHALRVVEQRLRAFRKKRVLHLTRIHPDSPFLLGVAWPRPK